MEGKRAVQTDSAVVVGGKRVVLFARQLPHITSAQTRQNNARKIMIVLLLFNSMVSCYHACAHAKTIFLRPHAKLCIQIYIMMNNLFLNFALKFARQELFLYISWPNHIYTTTLVNAMLEKVSLLSLLLHPSPSFPPLNHHHLMFFH